MSCPNANSIVGAVSGDQIGSGGLLSAGPTGNEAVVIASPSWNGATGAVRWVQMLPTATAVDGVVPPLAGATGVVGSGNSVVGGQTGDAIGSGGMTRLGNGSLVIGSPDWGVGVGASTWMDGATGFITGAASAAAVVSASNSLTGTQPGDFAGQFVTPLSNGNYVLLSPAAINGGGAATLVAGATGGGGQPIVTGSTQPIAPVSSSNSLVGGGPGALADASVAEILDGATGVDNGYLVLAPSWGADRGAVTFSRSGGTGAGPIGVIDASNSLVGSTPGDRVGSGTVDLAVVPLSAGWYAVQSPDWNGGAGAITFVTATSAPARLQGTVGAGNSLLGNTAGDHIGTFDCDGLCSAITDMGSGAFMVASPQWTFGTSTAAGAVTLVDPASVTPTTRSDGLGFVTTANSIHGTTAGDGVGGSALTFGGGVFALDGDRFAISSPDWNNTAASATEAGALTFGSVSGWTPGAVSTANSLYGSNTGDRIGSDGLFAIPSASAGTFGLASSRWNTDAGAVTFFDTASAPFNQAVSGSNSVIGEGTGDVLGSNGLADVGGGRALILSPNWRGGVGAATLVNANAAKAGSIIATSANSFTGSVAGDLVGAYGVTVLPNGNFVLGSDANGAIAYTFMPDGRGGQTLAPTNSLIGTTPSRTLGFDVRVLSSGDYIVINPAYDAGKGMIVFGSKDTGVAGAPNTANAWLGTVNGEQLGANVQLLAGDQFVFNCAGCHQGRLHQRRPIVHRQSRRTRRRRRVQRYAELCRSAR